MMAKWFRSMARLLASAKRNAKTPHRAQRARLLLESLEDRVTPSTSPIAVTSYYDSAIYQFNTTTGALMNTLVAPNSQTTLQNPAGITVGPDGNLYVSSQGNDSIVEYKLTTHSLSTFIPSGALSTIATSNGDGVFGPAGLAFGPDGNLYVTLSAAPGATAPTGPGAVVRFDIIDNGALSFTGGSAIIASAPTLNVPTGLADPTEMVFGIGASNIDTLYVSNSGIGSVVAIPHATAQTPGAMTTFIAKGSGAAGHTLNYPTGLTWVNSGVLDVVDLGATTGQGQVLKFKMPTVPASTTIAAGSNGKSLPQAVINVSSTAGFPSSGNLFINAINQTVSYTGKTATSFAGVTGGTGILATGETATSTVALAQYLGEYAMPHLKGAFPSDAVVTSTGLLLTADLGPSAVNGQGTINEFASNGLFVKTLASAMSVPTTNSDFTPSQLTLNLGNMAPTVSINGNYFINEGNSVTLHAIGVDAQGLPLNYSWDINGDGTFGDAIGANVTVPWSKLVSLGISAAGTYNIRVIAYDGQGQATTSQTATLTVNYTPVTGPQMVVTSFFDGAVYEFGPNGGPLVNALVSPYSNQSSLLTNPADVTDGPDGNLYISNQVAYPPAGATPSGESIVQENLSTNTLTTFITTSQLSAALAASGTGDTHFVPSGIAFGPDGNLYVALNGGYAGNPDIGTNGATPGAIVRFNIANNGGVLSYTGTFSVITTTVDGNQLLEPNSIAFGVTPADMNNLYVSNSGGGFTPGNIVKITNATSVSPTASVFVKAGTEGLSFPSSLKFAPSGVLLVADFGGSAVISAGRIERFGTHGQALTPLVTSMPGQFPSDMAYANNGNLLVAEFGPNYPPNLLGSIRAYNGAGLFAGTVESSSQFAITGPGDSGFPSTSGFSPSALVLNAGTRAPVVNPGTGYIISEGSALTLNTQAQDPNGLALTYSYDVNGDGIFGDAVGKSPTLSWAQLVKLGINQPGTWNVQVMVADAAGHVVTSTTVPLTVDYKAPTIRISGAASVRVGQTYTLNLASLPTGAIYNISSWTINWGDGNPPQVVTGNPATVTHTFTKAGRMIIKAQATDDHGTYDSNNLSILV
jgi:sugar lactone lactonase YvrE